MSSDVIIRAEALGKKYVIGHQSNERYTALRDVMAQATRNFVRTTRDMFRGQALVAGDEVEEFWALKDVNFEIKRGDVVGIIGRNGAGKSTLLKVLSRITEPTEGRVEIKGRVASLLEVGTGFHPELSGRENIYLNGAILGMSRDEINRKFDEIVDFSGVEKFLDTPVKRYSSGMYVRLAFAVAAHLEPEILIIDEVLAVGDAEFQKKCLGKMQDVAGEGRTVLFVSHNIGAIRQLCSSGFLLANGQLNLSGEVGAIVEAYANEHARRTQITRLVNTNQDVTLTEVSVNLGTPLIINLQIFANSAISCAIEINFHDLNGNPVAFAEVGCWSKDKQAKLEIGTNYLELEIDNRFFAAGTYAASIGLTIPGLTWLDSIKEAVTFDYDGHTNIDESGTLNQRQGHGSIRLVCQARSVEQVAGLGKFLE